MSNQVFHNEEQNRSLAARREAEMGWHKELTMGVSDERSSTRSRLIILVSFGK